MNARFWAKVDKAGPEAVHSQTGAPLGRCWVWTACHDGQGYGRFGVKTPKGHRPWQAHRVAYLATRGELPPAGLDLDHLCRRRDCVNPDHLEPVTRRENLLRGDGPALTSARRRAATHCKHGHEFTVPNTSWKHSEGVMKRGCRECQRREARDRARLQRALRRRRPGCVS